MWHPTWGCYSTSGCPHNPTPGDLPGQPMVVASILMARQWDLTFHTALLQGSGLTRTSNVADSKFDYAYGNFHRGPYFHDYWSSSISRLLSFDISSSTSYLRVFIPQHHLLRIDFKALGDRLDAAFTEKLETIAQTLKASWNTPRRSSPFDPILPTSSSASGVPAPNPSTPMTSSTLDQHQQVGSVEISALNPSKLPIKAKPPLPPRLTRSAPKPKATPRQRRSPSPDAVYLPEDPEQGLWQVTDQEVALEDQQVETMSGEVQDPDTNKELLYLAKDMLPEHSDIHQPALDDSPTLSMQGPLCRDTVPPTRANRNRPSHRDTTPTMRITGRDSHPNTGRHHSRLRPDSPSSLRLCMLQASGISDHTREPKRTFWQRTRCSHSGKSSTNKTCIQIKNSSARTWTTSSFWWIFGNEDPTFSRHSAFRLEPVNSRTPGTRTRRR